jgi:hypothetical protein
VCSLIPNQRAASSIAFIEMIDKYINIVKRIVTEHGIWCFM